MDLPIPVEVVLLALLAFVWEHLSGAAIEWLHRVTLPGPGAAESAAAQALAEAQAELAKINMQDEFAKWARAKRTVDRLDSELHALESDRKSSSSVLHSTFKRKLLKIVVRVVFYLALVLRLKGRAVAVFPPYFLAPFSPPISPAYEPGALGAVMWLGVTRRLLDHAAALVPL